MKIAIQINEMIITNQPNPALDEPPPFGPDREKLELLKTSPLKSGDVNALLWIERHAAKDKNLPTRMATM